MGDIYAQSCPQLEKWSMEDMSAPEMNVDAPNAYDGHHGPKMVPMVRIWYSIIGFVIDTDVKPRKRTMLDRRMPSRM